MTEHTYQTGDKAYLRHRIQGHRPNVEVTVIKVNPHRSNILLVQISSTQKQVWVFAPDDLSLEPVNP